LKAVLYSALAKVAILTLFLHQTHLELVGLSVTDYSPAIHDRFSEGFPLSPVLNDDLNFIALEYDLTGVGWSNTTFVGYKGFSLISPRHFAAAQHYEHSCHKTVAVRILDRDGNVQTGNVTSIENLGYGMVLKLCNITAPDLALGVLEDYISPPSSFNRYAVLDLHNTSTAYNESNYNGLPIFHFGRSSTGNNGSPRIAETTIDQLENSNNDPNQKFLQTNRTHVRLQEGDSGHPSFHPWTNPDNQPELALLGVGSTISDDHNFISLLASAESMTAASEVLATEGFALRVVGNPSHTWTGGTTQNIDRNNSWGTGGSRNATSDRYVLLNGDASSTALSVNVNTNYHLRGLYFSTAEEDNGFSFTGNSVLTIGRGGLTNYGPSTQTFTAALRLGQNQYWKGGAGGLVLQDLDTNSYLLEVQTTGDSLLLGDLSGNGSFALTGGRLFMEGASSYSGKTWVHEGTLVVNGSISASESLFISQYGELKGSGQVPAISGRGHIIPGVDSILTTTQIYIGKDMRFSFTLSAEDPDFSSSTSSQNSLIRITGPTPFIGESTESNAIRIYINNSEPQENDHFAGGFFTDVDEDFFAHIESASYEFFLLDSEGDYHHEGNSYKLYTGPLFIELSTKATSADFGTGEIQGSILTVSFFAPASEYDTWEQKTFPPGFTEEEKEPTADPTQSGIPNLMAYALGLNPRQPDRSKLPTLSVGEGMIKAQFRRRIYATDLVYQIWYSQDLVDWTPRSETPDVINADADGDGIIELVEIVLPATNPSFIQLRVTKQEG